MTEVLDYFGADVCPSTPAHANLDNIRLRMQAGRNLPAYMLDMCTRMEPAEVAAAFATGQDPDPMLEHMIMPKQLGVTDERPLNQKWFELPYPSEPLVVSFTDGVTDLSRVTDIYDRRRLMSGTNPSDVVELLSLVTLRTHLLRGATWRRVMSREALAGEDADITTPEAVNQFIGLSLQTDLNSQAGSIKLIDHDRSPNDMSPPELVIQIPVAAGQERETLPRLIGELTRQNIDFARFEIVLVHNATQRKATDPNREILPIDGDEIGWMRIFYQVVRENVPGLRFNAYYVSGREHFKIGYMRRLGHLFAAVDYLARSATNNPLMLNLDADTSGLNRDFLANLLETADGTDHPVVAARLKWDTLNLPHKAPTATKLLKFNGFLYTLAESLSAVPAFYDCGTAIRLREYCLAGGHLWSDEFLETGIIPLRMKYFKRYGGDLNNVVKMCKTASFKTHPRRQLDVMNRGHAPVYAWRQGITTFGEADDAARTNNLDYAALEARCQKMLRLWLEQIIESHVGSIDSPGYAKKRSVIAQGLRILGLPDIADVERAARWRQKPVPGQSIEDLMQEVWQEAATEQS